MQQGQTQDQNLLSPELLSSNNHECKEEDSAFTAVTLVCDVLYGNRDNVNFIHELYRQAFLLDFNHAGAIRKAIAVYKDWIQSNVSVNVSVSYSLGKKQMLKTQFYFAQFLHRTFRRLYSNRWTATRSATWRRISSARRACRRAPRRAIDSDCVTTLISAPFIVRICSSGLACKTYCRYS